jgi:hypothetical protein
MERNMNNRPLLCVFVLWAWILSGCAPTSTSVKPVPAPVPSDTEAKYFDKGINTLADKLLSSSTSYKIGKITVADFIGPGDQVFTLGEYVADKISSRLFSSGKFPDFMERKQLRQVLLARKGELSGYFDPATVEKFGKLIGVDSMVIGKIWDLDRIIDITAKIVESGTGRLQGKAEVRVIKDEMVGGLLRKARTATLTIITKPAVGGTVVAGGKQGRLQDGMLTLTEVPYGECQVIIKPEGYAGMRKSVAIRSRTETLTVSLPVKIYDLSFQIIPPDASLFFDGQSVSLNPQGFAKITDLEDREYSYVVRAEGYPDKMERVNPARQQLITLELETNDPFYATKNKFFDKVRQAGKRQSFSVRLWTDRSDYRLGDPIFFYFRAEKDCYLNLVDIASNGEIRLIFPNRFHPDSYVQGGVTYRLPDENHRFSFEVEPPAGTERVYAIASTRPLDIFTEDFREEPFLTFGRSNTRGIKMKGIEVKLDQSNLSAAAECVIHIR